MSRFYRGFFIVWIVWEHGLDDLVLSSVRQPWLRAIGRFLRFRRDLSSPRGVRLREALERLGPIFVKFGQVLSTRRDLLPQDIALELAKLQDRVPPFASEVAVATIERAFGKSVGEIFSHFEHEPVASASIAQVHFAQMKNKEGQDIEVAVKVIRPNMKRVIEKDLALMRTMAQWLERLSQDGRRLKPIEVVAEFDKYLHDELDLVREAANAAQLRRNMQGLNLVMIPEMYWDYCHQDVIVMERMNGVPISQVEQLKSAGVDIKKLARDGVTLFLPPRIDNIKIVTISAISRKASREIMIPHLGSDLHFCSEMNTASHHLFAFVSDRHQAEAVGAVFGLPLIQSHF